MNDEEVVVEETTEEETVTLSREEYERLNQTLGSLKKEIKTYKKEAEPQRTRSDEPDYAQLAYLASQQINDADDQKMIMSEADKLKLPLTEVLKMDYMREKLQVSHNQRVAEGGSPSGLGRKGGASKGDVDYYLANPDITPPDLKLHNEVIDARIKREHEDNMFSKVPFIG